MRSQLRPILQPILGERRHIQDRDLNLEMAATEAMRAIAWLQQLTSYKMLEFL